MGDLVEFVGDFCFFREGEGAKRVAMMLIWKIVGSRILRASLGSGGRYRLVVRFRK